MSAPDIKGFQILIPPLNAMQAFERIAEPLTERVEANICESGTLAAMRDTLLPKLISGELRVPHAERLVSEAGV